MHRVLSTGRPTPQSLLLSALASVALIAFLHLERHGNATFLWMYATAPVIWAQAVWAVGLAVRLRAAWWGALLSSVGFACLAFLLVIFKSPIGEVHPPVALVPALVAGVLLLPAVRRFADETPGQSYAARRQQRLLGVWAGLAGMAGTWSVAGRYSDQPEMWVFSLPVALGAVATLWGSRSRNAPKPSSRPPLPRQKP